MNRNIYIACIFFVVLHFILSILQNIIYFQLGAQTYTLDTYPSWYACFSAISLIATIILLKYFWAKRYRFSFWSAAGCGLMGVLQFVIVFNLIMGRREFASYYFPIAITFHAFQVIYAASLITAPAGKKTLLRTAGIFQLILSSLIIYLIVWSALPFNPARAQAAEQYFQWVSFVALIVPVFYLVHFIRESKEDYVTPFKFSASTSTGITLLAILFFSAFSASLVFGARIYQDSYWVIDWNKKAAEREMRVAEPFEARYFANHSGDSLPYRLFKPVEYDSTKAYPLVVCLHHGGTHGNDNVRQVDGSQPAQVLYQQRMKYRAFLFVPQCAQGSVWGGMPMFPAIDSLVFEAIASLESEFSIDAQRRYVIGISGGGYGSWHFISAHPEMFAAAVPICGGGDTLRASHIKDVAVWAFHGENDRSVPVAYSRDMIESVRKAGGNPKYTEFPGAGHNIWDLVNNTPGLYEWMFQQKRNNHHD